MARFSIEDTTLTDIAKSIRAKTGSTEPIAVTDMATQIRSIEGGGGGGGSVEGCHNVTFMNGTTPLLTRPVYDGDDCPDPLGDPKRFETPIKETTIDTVYTHNGWAAQPDSSPDEDALKDVKEDRTLYATYKSTDRTYTITWLDEDGSTLRTTQVAYGRVPTYTPEREGYRFTGWSPEPVAVTGDAMYTASWFELEVVVAEIEDSWDDIISAVNDGSYKTKYKIGNYKPLTLTGSKGGTINMQIVTMDEEKTYSGGENIALSWVAIEALPMAYDYKFNENSRQDDGNGGYVEGTGAVGGWDSSGLRTYLQTTVAGYMPENVMSAIKKVRKKTRDIATDGSSSFVSDSGDTLWVPSYGEVFPDDDKAEKFGAKYSLLYFDNASRVKKGVRNIVGLSEVQWTTRSPYSSIYTTHVKKDGSSASVNAHSSASIVIGFCI